MVNYYVYILRCKDDTLYTGYTTDIFRRISEHESGKGAKYTRGRGPFTLVYLHKYPSKSQAMSMECQVKKLSKEKKLKLIESRSNELRQTRGT